MISITEIGSRLEAVINGTEEPATAQELLDLGEVSLQHWITAKDKEPTTDQREGFRILALHRQGAQGDLSFNACRETCREIVYHYNLVTMQPAHEEAGQRLKMMALVTNHLFLFISGKMETQQLGDFCCSSKPLHAE